MKTNNSAKQRASKALAILDSKGMLAHEKVHKSLLAFNDMTISSIPPATKKSLESVMVGIQRILDRYPIKTFEDYQVISEDELNEIVLNLSGLCSEILQLK
jgi:hypothetical protein